MSEVPQKDRQPDSMEYSVCVCGLVIVFILEQSGKYYIDTRALQHLSFSSSLNLFSTSLPHTACGVIPRFSPPSSIFLLLSLMHSPCRCSTCSSQVRIDRSVIEAGPAQAVLQWLQLLRSLVMTCTLSLRRMGFLMRQPVILLPAKWICV